MEQELSDSPSPVSPSLPSSPPPAFSPSQRVGSIPYMSYRSYNGSIHYRFDILYSTSVRDSHFLRTPRVARKRHGHDQNACIILHVPALATMLSRRALSIIDVSKLLEMPIATPVPSSIHPSNQRIQSPLPGPTLHTVASHWYTACISRTG